MNQYKDAYGTLLHYGDIVLNTDTHEIGMIVRSSVNDTPVLYLIKEFNRKELNYKNIEHNGARVCYERSFMPNFSALKWRMRKFCVPNVEFLCHGDRVRRTMVL